MVIIQRFNEGAIAKTVDSRYVFIVGKRISKSYSTVKELNDAWVENSMWSKDDGTEIIELKPAGQAKAKLVAVATVEKEKATKKIK